ncbi:MAG: hypothetical protein DI603_18485, partial [Roseateles depolymerans]
RLVACHRVHLSYVDTILADGAGSFKVTWPDAYGLSRQGGRTQRGQRQAGQQAAGLRGDEVGAGHEGS